MNYILEINAFFDWLETNPLPKSANALWHVLMHINNKAKWSKSFEVAILTLVLKTGFKRSELFEARNVLTQKGRITWKSRGGNLSAVYSIIPFCVHNTDTLADASTDANGKTNPMQLRTQTPTTNKLNETKLNETKPILSGENYQNENQESKKEGPEIEFVEVEEVDIIKLKKSKKSKGGTRAKKLANKILFATDVRMTTEEHQKLVDEYGQQATIEMIRILDNYKVSKGVPYKDDYRAILSWVVKRYNEDLQKQQYSGKQQQSNFSQKVRNADSLINEMYR